MARYLGVRALLIIPTAWILVTLVFFLMRGIGDPITASAGGRLTPAQIAERKAAAGFDRPLLAQYWDYFTGLFRGDFGTTLGPVSPPFKIASRVSSVRPPLSFPPSALWQR